MIGGEKTARTASLDRHTRTPFGTVDELSCYYDGPGEPNNVHLEAWLPGHLARRALREAVAATLAAQPRARARRARGPAWRRRYEWEYPLRPDADPVSHTTWVDEADLARKRASFLAAAPPLDTSPPLRLLLATGPGGDCLILNAHHAAFDGISCLQLLRSIAGNYTGPWQAAPREREATAHREPAGVPAQMRQAGGAAPGEPGAAGAAALPPPQPPAVDHPRDRPAGRRQRAAGGGLLAMAAARIAPQRDGGLSRRREPGYGFHLMACPRAPSVAPRPGQRPGTVNDVLIAAMILAISGWNGSHGRTAGRIRITMPLGGRQADTDGGAIGNLSRLATVTAAPPDGGTGLRALVSDVARQTRRAKQDAGPQVDPVSRALAAAWCPAALKHRALRLGLRTLGPLVCDTSLISNLGNLASPPCFGPAAPTSMWFSTSAHMPRGLSLGAVTIDGVLHLCFRYRRALFDDAAAAQFAAGYAMALSQVAGAGPEV